MIKMIFAAALSALTFSAAASTETLKKEDLHDVDTYHWSAPAPSADTESWRPAPAPDTEAIPRAEVGGCDADEATEKICRSE